MLLQPANRDDLQAHAEAPTSLGSSLVVPPNRGPQHRHPNSLIIITPILQGPPHMYLVILGKLHLSGGGRIFGGEASLLGIPRAIFPRVGRDAISGEPVCRCQGWDFLTVYCRSFFLQTCQARDTLHTRNTAQAHPWLGLSTEGTPF